MAAPVLRGQTAPVAGGSSTSPASTQVGDLVVVYTFERLAGAAGSTLSVNAGAGFSQIRNHFHDDSSTDGALAVAYKVATQAGAQSYQGFTSSTGTPVWWTGCTVYEAGTFDASEILSNSVSQTNNAVPNPPQVTGLTSTRDYVVLVIAGWHLGSSVTNTATAPTNYTNLSQLAGAGTGDLAVATRDVTGVTSEDPAAFGDNQAPNGTCSITVAIPAAQPPAEGTGTVALSLGSSGEGRTIRSGLAAAALVLLTVGVGEAPELAAPNGSGIAALSLSSSASGSTVRSGTGSNGLTLGVAAAGTAVHSGQAVSSISLSSQGAGAKATSGSGSTGLTLANLGSGASRRSGTASVPLILSASGEGDAPVDAIPVGSSSVALMLASNGAGQSARRGDGAAPLAPSLLGVGSVTRSGDGISTLTLAVVGSGSLPGSISPSEMLAVGWSTNSVSADAYGSLVTADAYATNDQVAVGHQE